MVRSRVVALIWHANTIAQGEGDIVPLSGKGGFPPCAHLRSLARRVRQAQFNMNFARSEKRSAVRFSSLNELELFSNTYHLNSFHKRLNVSAFLGYSSSMTLPIGRPPNRQTMADRTARIAMVGECTKAFPKVMKFWLEALEGTATYKQNGQEFFKYSVADQF